MSYALPAQIPSRSELSRNLLHKRKKGFVMNHFTAYNMPKIELHCHLDGSLTPVLVQKLLKENKEEYTLANLQEMLMAPADCKSLSEYLKSFDLPVRCLQTKEGLFAAAKDLALAAAKEHVVYLEVRFAPSFSMEQGLSVTEIIESVNDGLKSAEKEADIHTSVIVCTMRHLDLETNLSMLKEARELLGNGVAACDLAGDEKAYPTADFEELFTFAKKNQIPVTIHSGECGSTENIQAAIAFGARRIGHGIAMSKDRTLMELCAKNKIGVELCPTSNLQTKAVTDLSDYPFAEFYKAGIPISINTDNRTVSNTTLTDEFMLLSDAGMLKEKMCEKIYMDSIACSFCNDDIKQILWKKWMSLFAI